MVKFFFHHRRGKWVNGNKKTSPSHYNKLSFIIYFNYYFIESQVYNASSEQKSKQAFVSMARGILYVFFSLFSFNVPNVQCAKWNVRQFSNFQYAQLFFTFARAFSFLWRLFAEHIGYVNITQDILPTRLSLFYIFSPQADVLMLL